MNTIRLELSDVQGKDDPVILIFVDGVYLGELAESVEHPFRVAEGNPFCSGYIGLSLGTSERFFGTGYADYDGDRVALLGCGCGEEGCWPLVANIEFAVDHVTWRNFAQPHRPNWDLSALGPFVFDRKQYESAIAGLGNVHPHV